MNGVTSIPIEIAAEIADIGDEFVATEVIVLDALQGESPSVKTLREAREESKAKMAELRSRISRKL